MQLVSLLLLTAVGVSAHPSGHAHMHRALHEKRALEKRTDMITATIDGKVVSWAQDGSPFVQAVHTPAPDAAPAAAPAEAPAALPTPNVNAAASPAAGAVGQGISTYEAFAPCAASKKRASMDDIMYKGNTGCSGYGSNIKQIQSNLLSKYDYTITVKGGSQPMACAIWLKIGTDNGIDGFFAGKGAKTFSLGANDVQNFAIDSNTQGGLSCVAGDSVPLSPDGQYMGPWCEFDMANKRNKGWSGYDASQLVAGQYGAPMYPLKASLADGSHPSILYHGGGGSNAFLPGMAAFDGLGGNLPPGQVSLVCDYGYGQ